MNCGVLQKKIRLGQNILGPVNGFQHGTILSFRMLCNQRNLEVEVSIKPGLSTGNGEHFLRNLFSAWSCNYAPVYLRTAVLLC
jgi:hypothetical protein